VSLSPSIIIWHQSQSSDDLWLGSYNCRRDVTLAMHHRLQWGFIHLQAQGLSKGDEHLSTMPALLMGYRTLYSAATNNATIKHV